MVTRQKDWQAEGAVAASSLGQATAGTSGTVMVIGGAEIYERALPLATRIELTEVHQDFDGDARFDLDRRAGRRRRARSHVTPDGLRYSLRDAHSITIFGAALLAVSQRRRDFLRHVQKGLALPAHRAPRR